MSLKSLPFRPTPTGQVVTNARPATPEWFDARRGGITGTDLPKVLGLSKYGNALSVWRDKRGQKVDDGEMEAARWGHVFEGPVAMEWARRGETTVRPVGVVANVDDPWKRASLDRLVGTCPDGEQGDYNLPICGLEVKTRSAYKAVEFRSDIPDDVLAQVQWGLLVTGLHHMHVAVLIGGQKLSSFRVDREPDLERYLIDAGKPVWQAVLDGFPPEVHPDADGILLRELDDMYKSREGDRELPAEAWAHLETYRSMIKRERDTKATKTVAKTALVQLLGDGDTGLLDGRPEFTYKRPEQRDEITADKLRRLRVIDPDLYANLVAEGIITRTDPAPRFNLSRRTEK